MGGDRKELPSIDFEKLLMETAAIQWPCDEPSLPTSWKGRDAGTPEDSRMGWRKHTPCFWEW